MADSEPSQPSTYLHISLQDRNFEPLDQKLLSSPYLHTLDISVYYFAIRDAQDIGNPYWEPTHAYSELQLLKECLIAGGNLKTLCLSFKSVSVDENSTNGSTFKDWPGITYSALNFPWTKSDTSKFPRLEELELRDNTYHLTSEHCIAWDRATDWSALRKLDMGISRPGDFLRMLTDRAPNLKWLRCGIQRSCRRSSRRSWKVLSDVSQPSVMVFQKFISSIDALGELYFEAEHHLDFAKALPIILDNQGGHLKRVELMCKSEHMRAWKEVKYVEVLESLPRVEEVKIQTRETIFEGSWDGEQILMKPGKKYAMGRSRTDGEWKLPAFDWSFIPR